MPVLPGPCYVISDAHLGVAPPDTERSLLAFLRVARRDAGSLVVNGDLFDFWFEWRFVLPRAGFRVLAALAEYADAGIPVVWIAGNHDCWGGDIIRKDAGIDYRMDGWRGSIAGWMARVDHGDGLREVEDRRYRALRSVLRNPFAMRAFRWLHPDVGARIALGSSHASRTYKAKDDGEGLRRVAYRDLAADPALDLLVLGHSHVSALERTPTGQVYANAGTWLGDSTHVRITSERVELNRWTGEVTATPLAALSRTQ
ncbi:MAG: UDP-2,3-diacylglucosamine hydrolase [Gemmatimonadaceae bacterium]|nr:UDP-2,3-diacylglucosamine hydrolase [Gemmatimonadaceae bacterium]